VAKAKGKRSNFKADVRKFAENLQLDIVTVMRKLALDALNGTIRRTPVDTGRLRASWRVSVNAPDTSTVPEGEAPGGSPGAPADGQQTANALSKMSGLKIGDSVHISNSVEYAIYVEEDSHMLADTFTELTTQLDKAVKSSKRK
jgi:hypothetical protein